MGENVVSKEYLTEKEALEFKELFCKFLNRYKEKSPEISDEEWLCQLLKEEVPEMTNDDIKNESKEIVSAIKVFDENLAACNEASKNGVSKESWLSEKLQEAPVYMSVDKYGDFLQNMDDSLYKMNLEIADNLSRSSDGHIMMSPNLDGNIAENIIAKTAELSAELQGKNIKVEVLNSYAKNSVDIKATNLETGVCKDYQVKFGKTAQETIALIKRGDYTDQTIVVPTEQLDEIKEHFKKNNIDLFVDDHVDFCGVKGKSLTKDTVKALQEKAQEKESLPQLDYSDYQLKDLTLSIGKNAAAMGLQAAAVTTGLNIATKLFKGEEIEGDELVKNAIKTGADSSLKTVASGTLQVAVRKGIIKFIPKSTPVRVITGIACVGIENAKILAKIASGELSLTKGLDQMGRVTTSLVGGLWAMAKGAEVGAKIGLLLATIPVIGPALALVSPMIGGMVGYLGGSKLGDAIYSAGKKVANVAKSVAKSAVNGLRAVGRSVVNGIKSVGSAIASLFGF